MILNCLCLGVEIPALTSCPYVSRETLSNRPRTRIKYRSLLHRNTLNQGRELEFLLFIRPMVVREATVLLHKRIIFQQLPALIFVALGLLPALGTRSGLAARAVNGRLNPALITKDIADVAHAGLQEKNGASGKQVFNDNGYFHGFLYTHLPRN